MPVPDTPEHGSQVVTPGVNCLSPAEIYMLSQIVMPADMPFFAFYKYCLPSQLPPPRGPELMVVFLVSADIYSIDTASVSGKGAGMLPLLGGHHHHHEDWQGSIPYSRAVFWIPMSSNGKLSCTFDQIVSVEEFVILYICLTFSFGAGSIWHILLSEYLM